MSLLFNFPFRTRIFQTPAITEVRSGMNYDELSCPLIKYVFKKKFPSSNFHIFAVTCRITEATVSLSGHDHAILGFDAYTNYFVSVSFIFSAMRILLFWKENQSAMKPFESTFRFHFFTSQSEWWSWKQESGKRLSNRRTLFFPNICYLCRLLAPISVIVLLFAHRAHSQEMSKLSQFQSTALVSAAWAKPPVLRQQRGKEMKNK